MLSHRSLCCAGAGFLAGALFLTGCTTSQPGKLTRIEGETVVLAGEEPARLAFAPAKAGSVRVRSEYRAGKTNVIHYEAGRDYVVDEEHGEVRRTAGSRIPDFRTNVLYGVKNFDHGKYPGFGNFHYFAFVDYVPKQTPIWPVQSNQVEFLQRTQAKLKAGEKVRVVAFGDSITTGCDASRPELFFGARWVAALQQKYPQAKLELFNGATGGDSTRQGLIRLEEKVLKQKPDLVLLGFGMNDQNKAGWGVPVPEFTKNLETLVDRIRQETGAEVVLYSTFPPNPEWTVNSHNMAAYAAATEQVARTKGCAFADVYHNWRAFADKKKPEDMLANNINHPNDFGHWLYLQVLEAMGL